MGKFILSSTAFFGCEDEQVLDEYPQMSDVKAYFFVFSGLALGYYIFIQSLSKDELSKQAILNFKMSLIMC